MISFIVPAHNEARLLGDTLFALQAAGATLGEDAEIVVVDDDSSDDTALIARRHGVRVIHVAHRHIAATRNAGAAAATGDRLVFVDADTLVGTAVVQAALEALRNGAVGGGATVRLQGQLALHERLAMRAFGWLFRVTRIAPGCFLFCTREAFEATGGFDVRYYAGEDVAMSRALARHGRFVILRETVATSERKLRTFSATEHLRLLLRLAWRGKRLLGSREGLDLWYGGRRGDPP